jgi:arylformamidase
MLIDITRPIHPRMRLYPGDPPVHVEPVTSIAADGYAVSRLHFSTHTGTHLDPPAHFIAGGLTVDQAPLDLLVGPARVVVAETDGEIGEETVAALGLRGVERVLFRTSSGAALGARASRPHSGHLTQSDAGETPAPPGGAWLSPEAARLLAEQGTRLVGIDTLSIDPLEFPAVSAHHQLLSRGVWILESLDLSAVAPGDYELLCLPLKIASGDGAPARVLLRRGVGR